ncbi:MAG: retention module-containing protein [Methylomicrobium sp.]
MAKFGIVKFVTGTVKAVSTDGAERVLQAGDKVLPDEVIVTADNGNIVIEFNDGTTMDLGRNQQITLNEDALIPENPVAQAATQTAAGAQSEVAAIQQALFDENFDPTKALKATAAGGADVGGGGNEGHGTVYVVDYNDPRSQPDSGFDTTGISVAFPQMEEDLILNPLFKEILPVISISVDVDVQIGGGTLPPPDDNGIILIPGGTPISGGVSGTEVVEGSDGIAHAVTFFITLSQVSTTPVTLTYTIVPGTASNPEDFFDGALTGTVTIPAGYMGFAVTENIVADFLVEGNETFKIVLSNVQGAILLNNSATVTIIDDDVNADDDFASTTESQLELTLQDDNPANDGTFLSGNVLDNDETSNASLFEPLTVTTLSPISVFAGAVQVGTITFQSNGNYTLTLNSEGQSLVSALAPGQSIQLTADYSITNQAGSNSTDTATLHITIKGSNDTPSITIDPNPNDNPAINSPDDQVFEAALTTIGSNQASTGEFANGTFAVSDPDSLSDIESVTINGQTFQIATLVGATVAGQYGTLTITAYDSNTGIAAYQYELTKPYDTNPSADNSNNLEDNRDVFTLTIFDGEATSAPAVLNIDIVDDVPTAVANTTSVTEGADVSGNVLTDGTDDVFGADGATAGGGVVGVATAGTPSGGAGVGAPIAGLYGTLTLNADGSYTYAANPNVIASNQQDVFVYTIEDGDGDLSTTTLTIDVANVAVTASDAEALVNEAGLPTGSNAGANSEIFNGAITPAGGTGPYTYTLTSSADGAYGNLVLNADGSYTYTLDTTYDGATANNGITTEQDRDSFSYTVTDANGNTTTGTILVDIVDDVPTATSEGTVTVSEGSSVNGAFDFVAGADGATITSINGQAAVNGTITVITSQGQLVVNATTGAYTYTANNNTSHLPLDNFTATITDGDGDIVTATVSFDSLDVNTPTGGTTVATVDDDGLPAGNAASTTGDLDANIGDAGPNTTEAIYQGTLNFSFGNDGAGSINFAGMNGGPATIGQETVDYSWNANNNTLTATITNGARTGTALFTVQVNPLTGAYTVILLQNVLQAVGQDENDATAALTYSILDSDGSPSSGTLNITFDDDAPSAYNPVDGLLNNAIGDSVTGSLNSLNSLGADRYTSGSTNVIFSAAQEHDSGLTSGGDTVYYYVSADGKTLTASTSVTEGAVNGTNTIFTVGINDATDQYTVTMYGTLDNNSGSSFGNLSGTGEAGNPGFKIVESTTSDKLEILFTPLGAATSVNSDSDDVAAGSQFIVSGDGLRIDFGAFHNDNKGTANKADDTPAIDDKSTINGFRFGINQISGGTTATLMLAAYDSSSTVPTDAFNQILSDDVKDGIDRVEVYANDGSSTPLAVWTDGMGSITVNGITFTDNVDGTVSVSDMLTGYNVAVYTDDGYDSVQVWNDATDGTDGKFSLDSLQVLATNEGDPLYQSFDTTLTDADGDTSSGSLDITFAPAAAITGTSGDDDMTSFATAGDDIIYGGAGNDKLIGGEGNDTLMGDSGNDILFGGSGSDALMGGAGHDAIYLGQDMGANTNLIDGQTDTIEFGLGDIGSGPDNIYGFDTAAPAALGSGAGGDVLNISDLLSGTGVSSLGDAVANHYVSFTQDAATGGTIVNVDTTGTGSSFQEVAVLTNVTFTDASQMQTLLQDNIQVV